MEYIAALLLCYGWMYTVRMKNTFNTNILLIHFDELPNSIKDNLIFGFYIELCWRRIIKKLPTPMRSHFILLVLFEIQELNQLQYSLSLANRVSF